MEDTFNFFKIGFPIDMVNHGINGNSDFVIKLFEISKIISNFT